MPLIDSLIGPIASIIDKIIPDKEARAKAKLELLALEGSQELKLVEAQMAAIIAEAQSPDPWTSRARPSFLYVMYAMILFALPMGVLCEPTPARPTPAPPSRPSASATRCATTARRTCACSRCSYCATRSSFRAWDG